MVGWAPDVMLIDSIEAGISVSEYEIMSLLDLAYAIVGYRQRNYSRLSYERYIAYITMQPHLKKGQIKEAVELFPLPTDTVVKVDQMSMDDLQEYWIAQDAKEWTQKGVLGA